MLKTAHEIQVEITEVEKAIEERVKTVRDLERRTIQDKMVQWQKDDNYMFLATLRTRLEELERELERVQ